MDIKSKSKKKLSFEDYLRQVADETQPLSVASLYRLSDLGEDDLALFELAWPTLPDERRRQVVRHLVDITEANFEVDCEAVFWVGLKDQAPEVREAAIDGLWVAEDVRQIAPLIKLMTSDPAVEVRAAAAGSLARFVLMGELGKVPATHHIAVNDLLDSLRRVITNQAEDIEVRRRALEAIAYSGDDDIPNLIHEAYQSPDERMRISAVCSMGRSADDRWKDIVIEALENSSPAMRFEAARAVGELELRSAVAKLAALLEDSDREVQEAAVWALGQIGNSQALKLLHACYEGEDDSLREAAGEAIEEASMMRGMDFPLFAFDPAEEDEPELDQLGLPDNLDEMGDGDDLEDLDKLNPLEDMDDLDLETGEEEEEEEDRYRDDLDDPDDMDDDLDDMDDDDGNLDWELDGEEDE